MLNKVLSITALVIVLIVASNIASLAIDHAPKQTEELVTVVTTYDNVVEVETEDGNIYYCYGTTNEVVLVAKFSGDELIDLNSVNNYTVDELIKMCGDTQYIVKDNNLTILNPEEYQGAHCINAGLIDDIDELGYCFFI